MRPVLTRTVLITVLVAVVVVLAGKALGTTPEQRRQVDRADAVATSFQKEFSAYKTKANKAIAKKSSSKLDTYAQLRDYVQDWLDKAPLLPVAKATAYGRSHSTKWTAAVTRRDTGLQPYRVFLATLRSRGVTIGGFVSASYAVLRVDPAKILPAVAPTGAQMRDDVRPAFTKAQKKLHAQKAVATRFGQQSLYDDLDAYLKKALKETDDGADKLDVGQPFFFDLSKKSSALYARIKAVDTELAAYILQQSKIATAAS